MVSAEKVVRGEQYVLPYLQKICRKGSKGGTICTPMPAEEFVELGLYGSSYYTASLSRRLISMARIGKCLISILGKM